MPEKIQIFVEDLDLVKFVAETPKKGVLVFLYTIDSLLDIAKIEYPRLYVYPHALVPEFASFYPSLKKGETDYRKDFFKERVYAMSVLWQKFGYIEIKHPPTEAKAFRKDFFSNVFKGSLTEIMERLEVSSKRLVEFSDVVFRKPIFFWDEFWWVTKLDKDKLLNLKEKLKIAIFYVEQYNPLANYLAQTSDSKPLVSIEEQEAVENAIARRKDGDKPDFEYAGFTIYGKKADEARIKYGRKSFIVKKGKVRKEDIIVLYHLISAKGAYKNTEMLKEELEHWYKATDNTVYRAIANIRTWLGEEREIVENQRTTGFCITPKSGK